MSNSALVAGDQSPRPRHRHRVGSRAYPMATGHNERESVSAGEQPLAGAGAGALEAVGAG